MTDISAPESARIHDPIHRVSMAFEHDGDSLWTSIWLDAGGHLPEHYHPTLTERWEVVEGSARVKVDGVWHELTAADGSVLVRPAASVTSCATPAARRPTCGARSHRRAGCRSS